MFGFTFPLSFTPECRQCIVSFPRTLFARMGSLGACEEPMTPKPTQIPFAAARFDRKPLCSRETNYGLAIFWIAASVA